MSESLPVYTTDPTSESELPAADPPQYLRRTASQEAANLKALKAWAEKRDMMNSGAYMETFHIDGKTVSNGHIVDSGPISHSSTSNPDKYLSAAQEKVALDRDNQKFDQDDASPSYQDNDSRPGVGKRISGFLKRISPAERAQQKAMAMTAEEEAADAKKYPMSEGTYGWENYNPKQ
ncbi:hypothetical protein E4T39_08570 [Aureobasidium subglaciale]|nr:hypothetical protein E4T39_08570 [Aureobasidium subglaciale]